MKIKHKLKNTCISNGITFTKEEIKNIDSKIGSYLLSTFPNEFEEIKDIAESIEVKTNNVDKTTKPKTTRTRKPKVDKAEEKSE